MSILRSNCVAVVPDDDMLQHEFKQSQSVEEIVPIFDKEGKKVREIKRKRVELVSIPDDVWENKGIKCEMFSLENQIAAGVPLREFTGAFIGLDLADSAQLGEEFINGVNAFVESDKAKQVSSDKAKQVSSDVEPIKFNE